MLRDIRFAIRQFAGRPGFTFTALLVLALGLGANTAIFSIVNAFLLRPLPYAQADRLVAISEAAMGKGGRESMGVSPGNFLDWQEQAASLEQMTGFITGPASLSSPDNAFQPQRVLVCNCSGNLLATLRVSPLLGRAFRPEEDRFNAPKVALVSYNLWQQRLGGSPAILGKSIRLDGDSYQVIGVMPRGFLFPADTIEVWSPLLSGLPPALQQRHDLHFLGALARVRQGVPVSRARAELDAIAAQYKLAHPDVATGSGAIVIPLHDALVQGVHTSLLILLGAVGCVLLIACVNVANLLLTRSSARSRELSLRAAIGASRGVIVRQLLIESTLLALAGGAAGLALARLIAPLLIAHAPGAGSILSIDEFGLQPAVFLFAFGIALAVGLGAGLVPALKGSRSNLAEGLRERTGFGAFGRAHSRFRGVLVAAEVALSLVLLIAAGLMLRSFARLTAVQPGTRTENILTLSFSVPGNYHSKADAAAFLDRVSERLRNIPGVDAVGLTTCPPLAGDCNTLFFYREDRPLVLGRFLVARERGIDPNYLAAAGLPLLRGRNFTRQDGIGFDRKNPRPGSLVISEKMAQAFFPGEDPIGKRIFFDYAVQGNRLQGTPIPKYEIVGVVGDVVASLDRDKQPTLYTPLMDSNYAGETVMLHTKVAPRTVAAAAVNEIHRVDASLAVFGIRTMEEVIGKSAADREFTMLLFGAFAALAVLLAAVGLYGVVSYAVTQRRNEIGIRMALGATSANVSGFILLDGLKPTLAGLAIGLGAAYFACRILKTMLFGVAPLDPLTFALAPQLLLLITAAACYLPALRAARIDPAIALRSE